MRLADTQASLVEVTIYDCGVHNWMGGGVTGDTITKVFANLPLTRYANHYDVVPDDNEPVLRWHGWIVRAHGDDGTTVTAGPQVYRKLTFVGTHDPAWHGMRGYADVLRSLLQDKQRAGSPGSTVLSMATSLRDQIITAIGENLEPIPA